MVRREEWVLVGIVVALSLALAVALAPRSGLITDDERLTITRPTPDGARALYLTLQELGVPVRERTTPLVGGEPLDHGLALLAPTSPLSPREVSAVLDHVRGGGFLIYVPRRGFFSSETPPLLDSLGFTLSFSSDSTTGFGHRWTAADSTALVINLALERGDSTPPGLAERPILGSDDSVVATELLLGTGTVLLIGSPEELRNRSIASSVVPTIVARAAIEATGEGGVLAFDEFHHGAGHGSVAHAMAAFLVSNPIGRTVAQLLGVALLALGFAGVRFGSPRPPPAPERRSPLEHVDALAEVYREARATRIPRVLLVGGLARHTGARRPGTIEEASDFLDSVGSRGSGVRDAALVLRDTLVDPSRPLREVSDGVDRIIHEWKR